MADESDGIEEALETTVRLAVMAGARLGSEIARAREERLREQRRVDEREAERLAQRFEAEKRAAVAEVSQVHRADWWERADAERIGQTYATARAWAPEAEEAARAERKMREELHERYGVDLDRTDPRAVAAEVEAWRRRLEGQRRQDVDRERSAEIAERAEAAVLLDQAARDDRQADVAREDERRADAEARQVEDERERNPWLSAGQEPQQTHESPEELRQRVQEADRRSRDSEARGGQSTAEAERLYDSADRRAAEVRALEAKGIDPEVAQNRMHADTAAGKPATLATTGARRGRAPKARRGVGRGAQVERSGVER
ncbi:MAG: hypothetical protein L0H24_04435 [Microlunatus sp.]|nr:hypothetical protein [Microlunatus sp.]